MNSLKSVILAPHKRVFFLCLLVLTVARCPFDFEVHAKFVETAERAVICTVRSPLELEILDIIRNASEVSSHLVVA